jgi:hypothetical protein
MAPNADPTPVSFSPARRLGIALNVGLSVLAVLALLGMANYLAARHYHRYQWAADDRYALSLPTRQALAAITNDIKVTILFDPEHPLYSSVAGLLKEYADACPHLRIEPVDYTRDVELARTLVERLQLPAQESDLVIFEDASQSRLVRASDLSDYDLQALFDGGKEIRRIGFKGEARFTEAIVGLVEGRSPVAYFLQGHGEHDPASIETKFGYSEFARLLRQKNVAISTLRLAGDADIPDNCQLLIVAGPRSRLDPAELEKINRYLNRGGRLLALLSFYQASRLPTGLEKALATWGVAVGDNLTFDAAQAVPGGGILATNFSGHPIVRALRDHRIYVVLARSVEPLRRGGQGADAPRVEPLFSTSIAGYTASEFADAGLARSDPERDRRGVIPLAVAVEKGSIQGVTADRGSPRLVVVGESIFLANETILKTAANFEFASLAVNWLLDRPAHLTTIASRPIREYRVVLSNAQLRQLRWLLLVVLPGVPLVVGTVVWIRRRR